MGTYPDKGIAGYINDFAIESVKNFRWQSERLHGYSHSRTINSLVESPFGTAPLVDQVNVFLTSYKNFAVVFSLKLFKYLQEYNLIEKVKENMIPIENFILVNSVEDVFGEMVQKLSRTMRPTKLIELSKELEQNYEPFLLYCFNVIMMITNNRLENEMISELNLMHEIEIFRNRRDDDREATDSSNR